MSNRWGIWFGRWRFVGLFVILPSVFVFVFEYRKWGVLIEKRRTKIGRK